MIDIIDYHSNLKDDFYKINKEWIENYLNEAHSNGLTSVRCHCNVLAWSDDRGKLRQIKNLTFY